MRRAFVGCSLGLLLVLTGCNTTRWNIFNPKNDDTPHNPKDTPTAAALVDYMNKNAERLQSLSCSDLRVTVSQGVTKLKSIQLDGKMVCQQPRNFRMAAKLFGKDEVDLGSNHQEFWYWIRRGESAGPGQNSPQIYCSYDALKDGSLKGKNLGIPFQPEWIMETLGMANFGPATRYQLIDGRDQIKLVEETTSPQGDPVKKIIVFNRKAAKVPTPQVTDFILVDAKTGKEICSAHIDAAQLDPKTAGMFPEKMTLNWPEHKLSLSMRLVNPSANVEIPQAAFVRVPLHGFPTFNLALGKFDNLPTSLQRVHGYK